MKRLLAAAALSATLTACSPAHVDHQRISNAHPAPQPVGPVMVDTSGALTLGKRIDHQHWWTVTLAPQHGLYALTTSAVATGSPDQGFARTTPVMTGTPSATEYAALIDDHGHETFIGNSHGHDEQTDLRVTIDGHPATGPATGHHVVVVRTSTLHRPSDDATLADVVTTYTETSHGLTVDWRITWRTTTKVATFYAAMLPAVEGFDRAHLGADTVDLTHGDDAEQHRPVTSAALTDGHWTATMRLTTPNPWAHSGPDGWTFTQDRAGNQLNKLYMTRVSRAHPVVAQAGDVWTSAADYTVR